jgi:cytochrome c biogenesis protein CcmG/thiol:disulfide interchange protein DsbE
MSSRVAVVIGLLAGILTATLVLAGVYLVGPDLAPSLGADASSPTATRSLPAPSLGPTRSPTPSAAVSVEPSDAGPTAAVPSDSTAGDTPTARVTLPPRSPIAGLFHVGEPAPRLVLPLLGGGTVDLAKLKGQPVWVNFMGTYCPPCRDEFPVMSGFQARYADTGLKILAVDVREDTETVQSFVGSTGAAFDVALDKDGVAQKAWGAVALPVHFWVDAEGIVRDGALGGIGPDQMAQSLALILPGVNVTP